MGGGDRNSPGWVGTPRYWGSMMVFSEAEFLFFPCSSHDMFGLGGWIGVDSCGLLWIVLVRLAQRSCWCLAGGELAPCYLIIQIPDHTF